MSGNSCLLDTNIIIALFNGEKGIAQKLDKYDEVLVPAIVAGELYFGAKSSNAKAKNAQKINIFLNNCTLLNIDRNTAEFYGDIKSILKKKGKPIPENDIWIAALAIQYNLPIITRDAHFKEVAGLMLHKW
jgi:tRNA(fMet)-specific endonuclease VapC